jgi:hypothetical protein
VGHFRGLGHRQVEWLPLACDPEIHGGRGGREDFDVGFVGNPEFGGRRRRLELLAREFTMNDWRRSYPKDEITDVYSRSRIVFNSSVNGDLNMRVFEAMASGKMLVTDRIRNGQGDLFAEGVHLVGYGDDEELLRAVQTYLGDGRGREAVARAGEAEVLSKHTYDHRVESILSTIFAPGGPSLLAVARGMGPSELLPAYAEVHATMRIVDPVLDELDEAWARGEWKAAAKLSAVALKTLLRRANSATRATVRLRGALAAVGLKRPPADI